MKEYDPKNNDTYTEKYTNSMARDVEIHMFKDSSANIILSVHGKSIAGNFSEESRIIARNNVLHFCGEKALGLKFLKYKNHETLIPYSLIKRYEHTPKEMSYTQKTPIFFNLQTEKFVFPLDKRFLRDAKAFPDFFSSIGVTPDSGITIVNTEENEQIFFSYDTLSDLEKDSTNIYKKFKEKYLEQLVKIYPSEDVIIIAYELEDNKDSYFKIKNGKTQYENIVISGSQIADHIFSSANIQFEFIKAKKISDTEFYLYNNENQLYVKKSFHFNKQEVDNYKSADKSGYNFLNLQEASLLIIPFSEKDLEILSSLKESIDNVFSDLDKLLSANKKDNGLDNSLTTISMANSNNLLLSNNSPTKTIKLK